jgi:cytochrome c2
MLGFCQLPVIFLQPFTDIFPHQEPQFVNMISYRRLAKTYVTGTILFLGFSLGTSANAQDGKTLFTANCAQCHSIDKVSTGPALRGVEDRWPDKAKLHAWIHNSARFPENRRSLCE